MNQARSWMFKSNVWWAVTLGALAGLGTGCDPSNAVKPGAAVMLSFGAVDQAAPTDPVDGPAYLTTVDAAGTPLIPPRSEFIAIFDRLLDPSLLEDPATSSPLPGLATLTSALPAVALDASTIYAPGGDSTFHVLLPAGPSFTVIPTCGLPSSAAGSVQLTMADFVSHDGKTPVTLATGVTSAMAFQTQPLAVSIGVPAATPDPAGGPDVLGKATPDTSITLSFNNLTPPGTDSSATPFSAPCTFFPGLTIASRIHATASVAGGAPAPVAAVISQNPMDATQWVVAPPGTGADGTGGAWPDGATITITVDAAAVDVFNQPLGADASASFVVGSAS